MRALILLDFWEAPTITIEFGSRKALKGFMLISLDSEGYPLSCFRDNRKIAKLQGQGLESGLKMANVYFFGKKVRKIDLHLNDECSLNAIRA